MPGFFRIVLTNRETVIVVPNFSGKNRFFSDFFSFYLAFGLDLDFYDFVNNDIGDIYWPSNCVCFQKSMV